MSKIGKGWSYKHNLCAIEYDEQEDCVKVIHSVLNKKFHKIADLDPYDDSKEIVELWIDAGCPERSGNSPLTRDDLKIFSLFRLKDCETEPNTNPDKHQGLATTLSVATMTDDTVNSISNYNNNSSGRNTLFNARSTRQAYLRWFLLQKEETTLHLARLIAKCGGSLLLLTSNF